MSTFEAISLFLIMLTLAAIPSASVALVVTRSVTHGIANGVAVSAGIVIGDLVFILLAILGLSFIAETATWLFTTIKYLGGAYLLWLGYSLITARPTTTFSATQPNRKSGLFISFFTGLLLTLGDLKAILFYASLLPTFVDLVTLSTSDLLTIIAITILTVGGVKIAYAISAKKVMAVAQQWRLENAAKKSAGGLMIASGGYLIFKT